MSLALMMACILALSLAGCGGSSAPVTRPTLTVSAANASRVYGAPNPVFTASASGALSGDTFTFTASSVATSSSAAGTYSIVPTATGANLANYNVVYVNGTLTVDKAALTVTPNNQSIVSGSVLPSLSATITGFVNGDTQSVVSGQPALTTTASSSSPAGSYPIAAAVGTLAAANYSFTFGTGTLTITPAANPGAAFSGRALAGTQPVVGATVQLYAAGTSGIEPSVFPLDTPARRQPRSFTSSSAEDRSEPPPMRPSLSPRRSAPATSLHPVHSSSSTKSPPSPRPTDSPSFSAPAATSEQLQPTHKA